MLLLRLLKTGGAPAAQAVVDAVNAVGDAGGSAAQIVETADAVARAAAAGDAGADEAVARAAQIVREAGGSGNDVVNAA